MLRFLAAWLRWKARRTRESTFLATGIRTLVAIELTRLGDFVTILPSLRALRKRFPGARIVVVTSAEHAPLIELCQSGLDVLSISRSGTLRGLFPALRAIRNMKPDLVCSMAPSNRNAALALASGAPFIVGYLNGVDSLTPFLDVTSIESIGFSGGGATFADESIQDRPWKVVQSIGISATDDSRIHFPDWNPDAHAQARLRAAGISPPYIVIHPFSGWEFRSWPLERFATLAERLLDTTHHGVVFTCHSDESVQLSVLRQALARRPRAMFFASADIMETAALIRGADLYIGNDSGPLHLAALLSVPVVGLFGPASPGLTAPGGGKGTFLYHRVSCSPCTQLRCSMPGNSCMSRITADEVFEAALPYLGNSRNAAVASYG